MSCNSIPGNNSVSIIFNDQAVNGDFKKKPIDLFEPIGPFQMGPLWPSQRVRWRSSQSLESAGYLQAGYRSTAEDEELCSRDPDRSRHWGKAHLFS